MRINSRMICNFDEQVVHSRERTYLAVRSAAVALRELIAAAPSWRKLLQGCFPYCEPSTRCLEAGKLVLSREKSAGRRRWSHQSQPTSQLPPSGAGLPPLSHRRQLLQ